MTKQLYRPTGGQWLSSNGGIILPPFVSPKGRVAAVRASALDKIVQPAQPFTLGTTEPDTTNTGPRIPVSAMTIILGDYTASTAGATISGLDIRGNLIINAPNVTAEDCRIRGHVNRTRTDLFSVDNNNPFLVAFNSTGGVIQFCDIGFDTSFGGFPGYWQNGIGGKTWKAYRNDIHDCTDWTDAQGGGLQCQLLGNFMHDISMRNDDANQPPTGSQGAVDHPYWSHSDGCQLKGTVNSIIRGNACWNYASATTSWDGGPGGTFAPRTAGSPYGTCAQITVDTEIGLDVSYNWFRGADVLFAANRPNVTGPMGSYYGNRHTYDQYTTSSGGSKYTVRWSKTTTMKCPNVPGSGGDGLDMNVWDDHPSVPAAKRGQPLTVGTSGGIRIP